MIRNGGREQYLAKCPMKNCFPQRRNAHQQSFVDEPETKKHYVRHARHVH
jgi:hypothetical protein